MTSTVTSRLTLVFGAITCLLFYCRVFGTQSIIEHAYQGVSLSRWLDYLADQDASHRDNVDPHAALRKIGTNAVPFLLSLLRANEDSQNTDASNGIAGDAHGGAHIHSAAYFNERAALGFEALGAEASNAVPEFLDLYSRARSISCQSAAARSLGGIGPPTKTAVPLLLEGLAGTNKEVAMVSLVALGRIHSDTGEVVPVLAVRLQDDPDKSVRLAVIDALRQFKQQAKPAASILKKLLEDPDPLIRTRSAMALMLINPDGDESGKGRRYSPTFCSAAFKFVATFVMLSEANHCAHQIHLPVEFPITEEQLRFEYVTPPRLASLGGGALDTKNYSFGFSKRGILCYVTLLHPFGDQPIPELHRKQARLTSLLDTNQALEVARNWLKALDVSIPDLEKTHPTTVKQLFFYDDSQPSRNLTNANKVLLPIFNVSWASEGHKPAVDISIYGPTKTLLFLRQEDDSFSHRPQELVKSSEELLNIPDNEFSRFSETQREALLARHATTEVAEVGEFLDSSRHAHRNVLMRFPPLAQRKGFEDTNAPPPPAANHK